MSDDEEDSSNGLIVPKKKKMRSVEDPDLKVVVGPEDGEQQVFEHHSFLLANYSDYIDTLLDSPMAESQSRSLSFPDIQPSIWQKMISFVENPRASRRMTVSDATVLSFSPTTTNTSFRKGKSSAKK